MKQTLKISFLWEDDGGPNSIDNLLDEVMRLGGWDFEYEVEVPESVKQEMRERKSKNA